MSYRLPFEPKWSRKKIEAELSKRYYKKPYDRFMWWRSYTLKNKPLDKRAPFKDKIINGDFDYGPYLLEVELAKHTMNDKFKKCTTTNGEPDFGVWRSETSIDKARIKRLNEDYEKDEKGKLEELKKGFLLTFKMTKEDYEREVVETNAEELIDFYYEMEEKYGTYWRPLKSVKDKP